MEAGSTLSNLESARRDWDDGRRIYRRYRDGLNNSTSFESALNRNRAHVRKKAETLHEQHDRGESDHPDNAYGRVRGRIAHHGWFYGRNRLRDATRYSDEGLGVLAAVTTAQANQHFLAWRDAKNRVAVSEDAKQIDANLVFRAKREAVQKLRDAVAETKDKPFARKLLETARNRIDSGDSALGFSDYPRAEAYGRYLLGWGHAKHARKTARKLTKR